MNELAKKIFAELEPEHPENFSKIPERRAWLLLLLRMGMDLYLATGRDENTLVINELKAWAEELAPGAFVVSQALERLEKCSKAQPLERSILPDLKGSIGIVIATALVELAMKDARIDQKELQYLEVVFPQLSPLDPLFHQSWLVGELPEDNGLLDFLLWEQGEAGDVAERIVHRLIQKAETHRENPKESLPLHRRMYDVKLALNALRDHAFQLGSDFVRIVEGAIWEIAHLDHLRIAVLGEFKRGKSTFINAMLRKPDFMPTDELPCTSAITEIRQGLKDEYFEVDPLSQERKFRSREEFLKNTGDADERGRRRAKSQDQERIPEFVPRWEVSVPSAFFENPTQLTLIDTPGLNEDPIRDELAKHEARTSHAAVLVLSADQLLSSHEQDLVEEMGEQKVRGLVVAINRADLVSEERWDVMKQRVLDLLGGRGLQEKQIVFSNAYGAEEAIRNEQADNRWMQLFQQAEERIHQIMIENATPIRMTMLKAILDAKYREVKGHINKQAVLFNERCEELEKNVSLMEIKKDKCKINIQKSEVALEKGGERIAEEVVKHFEQDWEGLLEKLEQKQGDWDTSKNPMFSPKKAAMEIVKRAEADLAVLIQDWVKKESEEYIQGAFHELLEKTKQDLKEVAEYIEQAKGLSSEAILEKLFHQATRSSFGKNFDFGDAGGAIATVLTATASLIIGYVIADILLYYILSLVSGFLNPAILVTAAVLGITAAFGGGKSFVKNQIRKKVAQGLKKELLKESVLFDISKGVEARTCEVFSTFAEAVAKEAESYVDEAEKQWLSMVKRSQSSKEEKEKFLEQADSFLQKVEAFQDG